MLPSPPVLPLALTSARFAPPLLSHSAKERREALEARLPGFHTPLSPSPSSLSFCSAADGLICSLKPSGSGENDFFMFLLRREGEGLPGAMAGRGEEGWEACWDGPEEVFSCFSLCFCKRSLNFKASFQITASKNLFRRVSGSDENIFLLQLGSPTAPFFFHGQRCFRMANPDFTSRAFAIRTRRPFRSGNSSGEKGKNPTK